MSDTHSFLERERAVFNISSKLPSGNQFVSYRNTGEGVVISRREFHRARPSGNLVSAAETVEGVSDEGSWEDYRLRETRELGVVEVWMGGRPWELAVLTLE